MTKREIERKAVEMLRPLDKEIALKRTATPIRSHAIGRVNGILDFCESLGIKRAKLVRAVKEGD